MDFDLAFSGTTCVSVFIRGKDLICANVGDSRAIMCSKDSLSEWRCIPLSRDHKPEDPTESSRILKSNGRIEPIYEVGVPIGPSRIWLQNENAPGIAMTRSLGDTVAA